jgi:hypothetical protein
MPTPMTQFLEEFESLRWTLVWMYLSGTASGVPFNNREIPT